MWPWTSRPVRRSGRRIGSVAWNDDNVPGRWPGTGTAQAHKHAADLTAAGKNPDAERRRQGALAATPPGAHAKGSKNSGGPAIYRRPFWPAMHPRPLFDNACKTSRSSTAAGLTRRESCWPRVRKTVVKRNRRRARTQKGRELWQPQERAKRRPALGRSTPHRRLGPWWCSATSLHPPPAEE